MAVIHHVYIFISSCDFLDTAQYYASALNVKGEASSVAYIVIKSKSALFLTCLLCSCPCLIRLKVEVQSSLNPHHSDLV